MTAISRMLVSLAALTLVTVPAGAQDDSFQHKWFWGAHGGAAFQSTSRGDVTAVTLGGHWLITGTRSALLLSYDQELYPDPTVSDVAGFEVLFSSGRRINMSLLVLPKKGFYFGGGFTIHQITDPTMSDANVFPSQAAADGALLTVEEFATNAFLTFTGGFQLPMGRSMLLFANYQYLPGSTDFIFTSDQHVVSGGLRLALGSSFEEISTDRR
jgi:hypothetical protein